MRSKILCIPCVLCENNFLTEEHKNILPCGVGKVSHRRHGIHRTMRSWIFFTQTPQNQRSLSELVRGKQFAETMRKRIVLCRELRRDARYACVTIRMASTNKVCALLRKSAQSAWDKLLINRVFSPETSVCYIVLNWGPQNESKNNNFSNACISAVYKFVI